MHYVYTLQSLKDGTLYVGETSKQPLERFQEHEWGITPWTRAHRPFVMLFYEPFPTRELALKRERFFKTGKGRQALKSKIRDLRATSSTGRALAS